MLEAYCAFGDYESMMETVESLITGVAEKVLGTLVIIHRKQSPLVKQSESQVVNQTKDSATVIITKTESFDVVEKTINLTRPWKRARYKDLVKEKAGADWFDISPTERRQRAHDLGAEIGKEYEDFEVTGAVFEKLIEPTLIQPTFVTHLPKELVPLAKLSPDDPTTVEVFECCINGQEISPGYTEQNDPIQQRNTLEHQAGGEQQKLDEDFLVALEHGMPPAGGIGIGIDRLCMMLLGQENIRDVILFPQLKPK
jgi:lysyl-tRNA synthetase class 2